MKKHRQHGELGFRKVSVRFTETPHCGNLAETLPKPYGNWGGFAGHESLLISGVPNGVFRYIFLCQASQGGRGCFSNVTPSRWTPPPGFPITSWRGKNRRGFRIISFVTGVQHSGGPLLRSHARPQHGPGKELYLSKPVKDRYHFIRPGSSQRSRSPKSL